MCIRDRGHARVATCGLWDEGALAFEECWTGREWRPMARREPSANGRPGKLVGACLSDHQNDGLSMIYSFFDAGPDSRKALGTFIILDHIVRAARAGLPYVYLGYWVEGSKRMDYKTRFRPLERLGRDGWRRTDAPEAGVAGTSIDLPFRRERRRLLIEA